MNKQTIVMVVMVLITFAWPSTGKEVDTKFTKPSWLKQQQTFSPDWDKYKPGSYELNQFCKEWQGKTVTLRCKVTEVRYQGQGYVDMSYGRAQISIYVDANTKINVGDMLTITGQITNIYYPRTSYPPGIRLRNIKILKQELAQNQPGKQVGPKEELTQILQYLQKRAGNSAKLKSAIERALELTRQLQEIED